MADNGFVMMWKRDRAPAGGSTADAGPEAGLIARLQARESVAWAELYDAHHLSIWRYCMGRTGSRDLADDVAAQVFLEALRSIDRFKPQGKPIVAWLYTIARHHAAKALRSRRHEAPVEVPETADDGIETSVIGALLVTHALASLTKDQRDVVALRFYAGCSTEEIAAALGKKAAAVYSLEARALARLREALAEPANLTSTPDEFRGGTGMEGVEGR
jgi:RNA polymerase sigma-70 factor (ECF subfamily)